MEEPSYISDLIRSWMRDKKITQTTLAHKMGITQASLSMMLSGKANLPRRRLQEIVELLSPPEDQVRKVLLHYSADGSKITEQLADLETVQGIDFHEPITITLLEYWRAMPLSQRYELLAKAAEIREKNTGQLQIDDDKAEQERRET